MKLQTVLFRLGSLRLGAIEIARHILFFFLLLPSLVAQTSEPSPATELQVAINEKAAAVASGDVTQVETASRKLCALTLRSLAELELQQTEYAEAQRLYEQSLTLEETAAAQAGLAATYLGSSQIEKANSLTKQLVEKTPEDASLWRLRAQVQSAQGDFSGASQSLTRALDLHPDMNTVYMLGVALLQSQQKSKARELFERATQSVGDNAELHVGFGVSYQETGFLDDAIAEFQQALSIDSTIPNGHFLLGSAYWTKNDWSYNPDSLREFQAALKANPSDYKSNLAMGLMKSEFGQYEEADKYLHAALAAEPASAASLLRLGFNAFEQHDNRIAQQYLEQALRLKDQPADPLQTHKAYLVLSKIAETIGDTASAASLFKQARSVENELHGTQNPVRGAKHPIESSVTTSAGTTVKGPELAQTQRKPQLSSEQVQKVISLEAQYRELLGNSFNDWGTAEAKTGDYAAALAEFHEAERWNPETPGLTENLGLAAYKSGDYNEAARALTIAHAKNPDRAVTALLATSLLSAHRPEAAASTFAQIGPSIYDDPPLTYQWASALSQSQHREDALRVLSGLQPDGLAPDDALAIGRLYFDLNSYDQALTCFRAALTQNASMSAAHYGAGMALSRLNQTDGAIAELNLALQDPKNPAAAAIHAQLAVLYRLSGRTSDAAKEEKLSKTSQ